LVLAWASATRLLAGKADTNAKQVIVYRTPSPMTLINVARGTLRTGFFDSSA